MNNVSYNYIARYYGYVCNTNQTTSRASLSGRLTPRIVALVCSIHCYSPCEYIFEDLN